jgi:hypothetical protein
MLQRKKEIVEKIENIVEELNLLRKDIEGDKSVISKPSAVSKPNLTYKEVKTLLKFLNSICPSILEVINSSNLRDKVHSFRLDGQSYLVYGEVQSGKTNFLLGISVAHIILNRCPVIIVLRNSKEDADQLQNRFIDLVRKQKEECKIDNDSLQYFYLGENKSEEDLFRAVRECRIIVVIANKTQLNRLVKVLTPGVSYATVVDEADLVAYGEDDADYRKVLHEGILSNSGRTYAITATTFNVIFTEKKIPSGNIIQLPTQQEYRGLEDIEMRIINPKNEDELQKHLEMLSRKNAYGRELNSSINKTDHPVIMLIKKFHRKLNQQELARQVVEIGNWTEVIVFNGDGLTLYSKYIEKLSEIINVNDSTISYEDKELALSAIFISIYNKIPMTDIVLKNIYLAMENSEFEVKFGFLISTNELAVAVAPNLEPLFYIKETIAVVLLAHV